MVNFKGIIMFFYNPVRIRRPAYTCMSMYVWYFVKCRVVTFRMSIIPNEVYLASNVCMRAYSCLYCIWLQPWDWHTHSQVKHLANRSLSKTEADRLLIWIQYFLGESSALPLTFLIKLPKQTLEKEIKKKSNNIYFLVFTQDPFIGGKNRSKKEKNAATFQPQIALTESST